MAQRKRYWLFKTEPTSYSIDDLACASQQSTCWEGVRNYQARNILRDDVKVGDTVLIYHSNARPPSVMGSAIVTREGYPDHFAWNPKSKYFDTKSSVDEPRWFMVDVKLQQIFERPVGLPELRLMPSLSKMELLRKGSRLSVQPVRAAEYRAIVKRSQTRAP